MCSAQVWGLSPPGATPALLSLAALPPRTVLGRLSMRSPAPEAVLWDKAQPMPGAPVLCFPLFLHALGVMESARLAPAACDAGDHRGEIAWGVGPGPLSLP